VRAGQRDHSPVGSWRDGVCDCCIRGPCHPSCCISYWCVSLAVGQVMTRMRLSWSADPAGNRPGGLSPFKVMVILTILYFFLYMFVSAVTAPFTTVKYGEMPPPIPGWVSLLIGFRSLFVLGFFVYVLIARIRTRAYIRNKYAIPETYCSGCDDCCMSFWCGCCTTAQMLRHTADYDTNSADCCSETGLSQQEESPWV
jgi:Cys-rich protein (TIGR01571 family)